MKNSEIVKLFYETANIFELHNVAWKPIAYRKAARNIESMSENLEDIYNKGVFLPSTTNLSDSQVVKIAESIKKLL